MEAVVREDAARAPPERNIRVDENVSRALSGELCRCDGVHVGSAAETMSEKQDVGISSLNTIPVPEPRQLLGFQPHTKLYHDKKLPSEPVPAFHSLTTILAVLLESLMEVPWKSHGNTAKTSYIFFLLIPFIIFAHLLLSLLPTRNSDPGSWKCGSPMEIPRSHGIPIGTPQKHRGKLEPQ